MNTLEQKTISYPYPGLRPFGTDEAEVFFGRDEHIDDLLSRLQRGRFLGVVGPSGCGKSSLIRAGLIPALQAGFLARAGSNWQVAVMRPGAQPLQSLAEALRPSPSPSAGADGVLLRSDGFLHAVLSRGPLGLIDALSEYGFAEDTSLLLLVDQFEELFRFSPGDDGSEARAFVDLLLTSVRDERFPIHVVLTMRSDFLGQCPIFRGLPEMLNDSQYLTPRLNREQQRAAIEGPAALFNVTIRPEVVNRILNAMGADPDQLPLMQHLLMRMWRTERLKVPDVEQPIEFTMETYRAVGGLQDCVSMHAERIFGALRGEEPRIAELLFRHVTDVAADSRLIRRPRRYGELCEQLAPLEDSAERAALRTVIDSFRREGRSFLMPPLGEVPELTAHTLIDISHESVIRQWERLKKWAWDEHRVGRVRKMAAEKAARWKEHPADKGYLLSGVDFAEAREWRKKFPTQVGKDEGDLLNASIMHEKEALNRLVRRNRILLSMAIVAVIFAAMAVLFAVKAHSKSVENVQAQQVAADERLRTAEARLQATAAEAEKTQRARSMISSYIGNGIHQMDDAHMETALLWFAEAFNLDTKISKPDDEEYLKHAVIHRMRLAGVLERCPKVKEFLEHKEAVSLAEFSPNGKRVVTVSEEGTAKLWEIGTAKPLFTLAHDKGTIRHASFSPKGDYVATSGTDNTALIWEAASGKCLTHRFEHDDEVRRAFFSQDGSLLVTVSKDTKARLWKWESGEREPWHTLEHKGYVYFAAFSPDGQRLVTVCADKDRTIRIWDVRTGEPLTKPLINVAYVTFAAFSPNSDRLVTVTSTGDVSLRDVATGTVLGTLGPLNGPASRASFTSDGQRVLTMSTSGPQPQLWDAVLRTEVRLPVKAYGENDPAYSPDGRFHLLWTGMNNAVEVRDNTPVTPRRMDLGKLSSASFRESGKWLLAVGEDKTVKVWDVTTGKPQAVPLYGCDKTTRAWLSPDGRRILTAGEDIKGSSD